MEYKISDENIINDPEAPEATEIARAAIVALDSKKASDIRLLRVHENTVLADYFIICTGSNTTQIKALAGEVETKLEEKGFTVKGTEGLHDTSWVILDYGCVIIHIFKNETRNFYGLEKLWADAESINIEDYIQD